MIPTFILFKSAGWYDTFYPLIVPAFLGGGAYNIFLMRQFFMSIPYEMDEAAKIDGCTNFGVYWRILLPLCKPALTTVAVFSFVYNWNDFLNPLDLPRFQQQKDPGLGVEEFRFPLWPGLPPADGGVPFDFHPHCCHVLGGPEVLHPGNRDHGIEIVHLKFWI